MAHLEQERHIELVSGTEERFVITSRMTDAAVPAELPHLNVFVLKVVDRADAKKDALARVARLSDVSLLPVGRDRALKPSGEYLASAMTLSYATLSDALLAQTTIKDRVNQLIQDWIAFTTRFNAPDPTPANFPLPSAELPQKAALIQAYRAAKQDRYQKQRAKEAADDFLARVQAAFSHAQDLFTVAETLLAQATANQDAFTTTAFVYDVLRTGGSTFLGAAGCAPAADRGGFASALEAAASESNAIQGRVALAGGLVAALVAFRSARGFERDVTQSALTTATTAQVASAQALAAAEQLEASALAAVRAICPDFDPATVCLVAG